MAEVRIGVSGWRYAPWRGSFYPRGLPQRRELEFIGQTFPTVELNGSFYSLQRPTSYERWRDATPPGFTFAVKGGRFITHLKALSDVDVPLANFFASGVLALGDRLGPVLWQLPARRRLDLDRVAQFLALLPRTTARAAELAAGHDERLDGRALTTTDADRPLRHALEVRHESFADEEFVQLLRHHDVALVVSDGGESWPVFETPTAGLVYVRLHGAAELYVSGYDDAALRSWAAKVRRWHAAGHDVVVYFDNDAKVRAPFDALALTELLADVAVPAPEGLRDVPDVGTLDR
ncbi:DUF72 domain-containing protein [Georgenia sp. 311]|uniref:DUF72 domain-containing protein n=1 Tax=Georgenia sp. 311 TaxID=2585134 RepID=UPI00111286DE|nr:DUF72 domain-containing protein [Georgenia sp. 311]TNC16825.1 DUF72 domain-containing protein [Georgenia sp. 311]